MSAAAIANLTIDQVRAGDELPVLAHRVTATTVVLGALASRDWRPMHHDRDFAINRNGVRDIFINTPNNAAWFERFVTDWTGPRGRLGRMKFRMIEPVFPGDEMVLSGCVTRTGPPRAICSRKISTQFWLCGWSITQVEITSSSVRSTVEAKKP